MFKKAYFFIFIACAIFSSGYGEEYPYRFEGKFEEYYEDRLGLLQKIVPEESVIFEAGAFDGTHTLKFAKKWPKGRIFSFEPNPSRYQQTVEKTAQFPNVKVSNIAIGSVNGVIPFYLCHGSDGKSPVYEGASSMLPPSEGMKIHYQGPVIEVPCVVLDDWCKNNGVDHIDFMWLDMEGAELKMLKSSPKILKTVQYIYTETNFQRFREGMALYPELRKFLEKKGFRLLSHWYHEGLQGDALFVRKEIYRKCIRKVTSSKK